MQAEWVREGAQPHVVQTFEGTYRQMEQCSRIGWVQNRLITLNQDEHWAAMWTLLKTSKSKVIYVRMKSWVWSRLRDKKVWSRLTTEKGIEYSATLYANRIEISTVDAASGYNYNFYTHTFEIRQVLKIQVSHLNSSWNIIFGDMKALTIWI